MRARGKGDGARTASQRRDLLPRFMRGCGPGGCRRSGSAPAGEPDERDAHLVGELNGQGRGRADRGEHTDPGAVPLGELERGSLDGLLAGELQEQQVENDTPRCTSERRGRGLAPLAGHG